MALTTEDRNYLYQVFENESHEVREGITTKSGKVRWWVYLQKPAIIRHLDEHYFGEWEDSYHSHRDLNGYSEVYCRLTICDISRENNGSNTGTDEHTGKGAATDAFKRAAMSWGIGLYLQDAPQIWTAYDYKTNGTIDYTKQKQRKQEALNKVFTWLNSLRTGEVPEQKQTGTGAMPNKTEQKTNGKPSQSKVTNRRTKVITAFKGSLSSTDVMKKATSLGVDWDNTKSDVIIQQIRKAIQ